MSLRTLIAGPLVFGICACPNILKGGSDLSGGKGERCFRSHTAPKCQEVHGRKIAAKIIFLGSDIWVNNLNWTQFTLMILAFRGTCHMGSVWYKRMVLMGRIPPLAMMWVAPWLGVYLAFGGQGPGTLGLRCTAHSSRAENCAISHRIFGCLLESCTGEKVVYIWS